MFTLMLLLLLFNKIEGYDTFIYNLIENIRCNFSTWFFMVMSLCCSTYFLIISMIAIMILVKDKKEAMYICLNVGLCCLLNQVLKHILGRSRPVNINLITENGFSFPSGHSMVSIAYYGFFVYLVNNKNIDRYLKIGSSTLLILLIILIGISRIYLGVHYASDVTAGFALGLAYLIVFINFIYEKRITK